MIFVLLLRWYIIVQKILEPAGSKTFKNANFTPKFQKIPNVLEPAGSKDTENLPTAVLKGYKFIERERFRTS